MPDLFVRSAALTTAVVPAFVILGYFLAAARVRIDAHLIWAAFGFGACTAFPAVMVAGFLELALGYGTAPLEIAAKKAFLGAAVPEEICKLVAVLCVCGRSFRRLSPHHLFVLVVATGCGFACLENMFYVVNDGDWSTIAALRSLTAVPGHAFMGAAMGFALVQAVHHRGGILWWFLSLVLPIAFHGAYNFPLNAVGMLQAGDVVGAEALAGSFVAVFIAIVIAEGVVAHIFLHAAATTDGADLSVVPNIPDAHPAVDWLQRLLDFPVFWGALGLLAWFCAGAIFLEAVSWDWFGAPISDRAATAFRHGLSVFAALHGVAFLGLAAALARRRMVSLQAL